MSTEAHKQLVGEFFASFSRGDVRGALALLADDATWWIAGQPSTQPAAGAHDKPWLAGLFERMGAQLAGPMPMTVLSLVAEGDRVAAEVRGQGRLLDGRRYENEYHFAITVRAGRIAAVREYLDTQLVVATWFSQPASAPAAEVPATPPGR